MTLDESGMGAIIAFQRDGGSSPSDVSSSIVPTAPSDLPNVLEVDIEPEEVAEKATVKP